MITLSTGAVVAIAKTYGSSITVTAAANSVAAGFTATTTLTTGSAHGLSSGKYVEITSGWGRLDKRIARCTTGTTGSTIVLENVDTFSTARFPTGQGVGSVREVVTWANLSQIKSLSTSGGDQQFADITGLDDVVEKKVPTIRSAVSMELEVFDDPTLSWYADVTVASDASTPYGVRITAPNGSVTVANAFWSLMKVPMIAKNEAMTTKLSLSYAADPVRYAA